MGKPDVGRRDGCLKWDYWCVEMSDDTIDSIDLSRADALKPDGHFLADYLSLCRLFEVIPHPSLHTGSRTGSAAAPEGSISVRNFSLDQTSLLLMLQALRRSRDVTTLNIYNAGLSLGGLQYLVEKLPDTTVLNLCLDYNPIVDDRFGAEAKKGGTNAAPNLFAALLGGQSKLRSLSLRGNKITDNGAIAIAAALEKNDVLVSVNLFDNLITDKGALAVVEGLKLNSTLRGLSLAKNRLEDSSAQALADVLAGYEASPTMLERRAEVEARISAHNKTAQEALKKKKDARVDLMLPLGELKLVPPRVEEIGGRGRGGESRGDGGSGRALVGGSQSLAVVNLSDNAGLGAQAVLQMLKRVAEARDGESVTGGIGAGGVGGAGAAGEGAGGVALKSLHIQRCGHMGGAGEEWAEVQEFSRGLHPTEVIM